MLWKKCVYLFLFLSADTKEARNFWLWNETEIVDLDSVVEDDENGHEEAKDDYLEMV